MGMAAGQARLLSITARMSDNELRAQIINNNKLRLATDSSRASETYIQALNNAKLMISNYDENNNATYQELTFNALTAYNPYNNQYALSNASGNVLISEYDAKNYESVRKYGASEDRLAAFLKCYGLENTTNYFNETLATACYSNADDKGNKYKTNNVYLPLYDSIRDCPLTDENGYPLSWNTGLTVEQLQAMYDGGSVINVNGTDVPCKGYMNTLQTQAYFNYQSAYEDYVAKKEDFQKYTKQLKDTHLDNVVSAATGGAYSTMAGFISDIQGITDINGVQTKKAGLLQIIAHASYASYESGAYISKYNKLVGDNVTVTNNKTYSSRDYCFASDGTNSYIMIMANSDYNNIQWVPYARLNATSGTTVGVTVLDECSYNNEEQYNFSSTTTKNVTFSKAFDINNIINPSTPSTGTVTVKNGDGTAAGSDLPLSLYTANYSDMSVTLPFDRSIEELKSSMILILNQLKAGIYDEWDESKFNIPSYGNSTLTAKYDAYAKAAVKLGNMIYGSGYTFNGTSIGVASGLPGAGVLDNFLESFYYKYNGKIDVGDGVTIDEKTAAGFDWNSVSDNFKQVLQVLILDAVMDTYGEPKYTYIDTNNPNENGDAKAQWYTNLFNRIEAGGYRTIKDGLASSPEWIKFAFESGIITLEQVDDKYAWNKMIYTSSADITEQTDSVAVTKAEAEYNATMNKIENKDKRYDMELKNIDTEHNSLQTEYDSIKNAVSKNIERTFKLYS